MRFLYQYFHHLSKKDYTVHLELDLLPVVCQKFMRHYRGFDHDQDACVFLVIKLKEALSCTNFGTLNEGYLPPSATWAKCIT